MAGWRDAGPTSIPPWFFEAIETEARTGAVEIDDCDVAWRAWGDPANPGVLLVHGMRAHARWWDFIAPQLADRYHVVAMDLCGMGDSDFRYDYSFDNFAAEVRGVCDAVGFSDDCSVVAHSFGGYCALRACITWPERFGRLVLVDSGIRHPDEGEPDRPPMGGRAKVYPDRETAENRFRLAPPQPCENDYILKYIARNSLMPNDGGGFVWKFDEDLINELPTLDKLPEDYRALSIPAGGIYGAKSDLYSARSVEYMRELIGEGFDTVSLDDAYHHVFLDQPLAFVAELRSMLERLGA